VLESQKYRQYAADCIRLSQTMTAADMQTLLEIASAWEKRAGSRAPRMAQSLIAPIDHALFFSSTSTRFAECAAF
jgi:hypothetical protein